LNLSLVLFAKQAELVNVIHIAVLPQSSTMAANDTKANHQEGGKRKGFFARFLKKSKPKTPVPKSSSGKNTKASQAPPPPPPIATPIMPKKSILKREFSSTQDRSPASSANTDDRSTRVSWLCRTRYFQKMCDSAFEVVDQDGSGAVDEKELYSGLLLIHLKLGTYAGPAACRPLGRERCHAIFVKMDTDNSNSLDKEEFREVMMVLFSNVLLRVTAQWSMTLLIVPLLAQKVLDGICWLFNVVYGIITDLDEHSSIANRIELSIEAAYAWILSRLPGPLLFVADAVHDGISFVPEHVWNTIPLTLLSTLLGLLAVPWLLFQIDDFFQYLADRKAKKRVS
jgi:hypothetical protein